MKSLCKDFLHHSLLNGIVLLLFLLMKDKFLYAGFVICLVYYKMRTKDNTYVLMAILICLTLIPTHPKGLPPVHSGKVVKVNSSSMVVKNKNYTFLVVSKEEIPIDAYIEFNGRFEEIERSYHFFQKDFVSSNRRQGIYYTVRPSEIQIVKQNKTIRYYLYQGIMHIDNEKYKMIAKKVLLGIGNHDMDSFIYRSGFSLTGILFMIEKVLSYFVSKRKKIIFAIGICLFVIYGYPLVLFQSLIMKALRFTKLRRDQILGIGVVMTLLLYKEAIVSVAFWIPFLFRLSNFIHGNKKVFSFYMNMVVQGIMFHGINPLLSLLFPSIRMCLGIGYGICMISIVSGYHWLIGIVDGMDKVISLLDVGMLHGSMLGFGLIGYVCVLISIRKKKKFLYWAIGWLFVFQIGGVFHPFAEVSFMNVGQGDSILLKKPFNQSAMLIDTGKPSQKNNVITYLHAKGIDSLDTLVITHPDSDHAGNKDAIIEAFQPRQVIEHHQPVIFDGKYTYYDLNPLETEDENQSSIVLYTNINGLKYLFMADADMKSEEVIVEQYNNLNADVLKLSHHGSKTGSSDILLDTVKAKVGIISSGAYSIYHHPSPIVIQKLLKRHIPYFDTKEEGDMTIVAIGKWNIFITSSGKIGIM